MAHIEPITASYCATSSPVRSTRPDARPFSPSPLETYLAGLAPGSRRTQRSALRRVAVALLGPGHEPEELDWAALHYAETSAVRAKLAESLSPASTNQTLSALRRVMRETWRLGLIDVEGYCRASDLDPVRGSCAPAGRALGADELRLLLDACCADRRAPLGARDAAVVGLLFGAGLRRGEAAALDLGDFDAGALRLAVGHGKAKRARTAWLAPWSEEFVGTWIALRGEAPGPLLLGCDRYGRVVAQRIGGEAIRRILARRACEAGLQAVRPHDARRTFISSLLEVTDLSTAALAAGHSRVATTAGYDRRPAERALRAVRSIPAPS